MAETVTERNKVLRATTTDHLIAASTSLLGASYALDEYGAESLEPLSKELRRQASYLVLVAKFLKNELTDEEFAYAVLQLERPPAEVS